MENENKETLRDEKMCAGNPENSLPADGKIAGAGSAKIVEAIKLKKIVIAFVLFFLSGILLGGIAGFCVGKIPAGRKPNPQSFRQHIFDRYVKELSLTKEQQQQMRPVIDKGFDRVQEFRNKRTLELLDIIYGNYDELKVFLNPEQLKKLEEMRKKTTERFKSKIQEKL
ncbi:MAG: hypothetical protein ACYC4Q_03775 [Victivallaceae bacterium]